MPVHEVKRRACASRPNNVYVMPAQRGHRARGTACFALVRRPGRAGARLPIDHLLPLPGRAVQEPGDRRRPLRHAVRRRARPSGDQGRGRRHVRAGRGVRAVPGHAARARSPRERWTSCFAARRSRASSRGWAGTPTCARARRPGPRKAGAESQTCAQILALLRRATGVDFTDYRQTTVKRRIARRMALEEDREPRELPRCSARSRGRRRRSTRTS